jgi:hypothetical protein
LTEFAIQDEDTTQMGLDDPHGDVMMEDEQMERRHFKYLKQLVSNTGMYV